MSASTETLIFILEIAFHNLFARVAFTAALLRALRRIASQLFLQSSLRFRPFLVRVLRLIALEKFFAAL
jgi:hypothetical protein